jgi:Cd2+/Zn2+-exporting ATPase
MAAASTASSQVSHLELDEAQPTDKDDDPAPSLPGEDNGQKASLSGHDSIADHSCDCCGEHPSAQIVSSPPIIPIASPKTAPKKTACCSACEERESLTSSEDHAEHEHEGPSIKRLIVASVLAIVSEIGSFSNLPEWLTISLAALAIVLGGINTWVSGWKAIAKFKLDITALMTFAVTGAFFIGEFSEGALVLVLFTLAEALEERSVERARKAIAALLQLAPETAFIKGSDGTWQSVQASTVAAGSMVRVHPGEKLALDGMVVSGSSAVDQAPITGESIPVEKSAGDQVFAGTLNISGLLEYEVTVAYGDSALSRIIKTVEEAERSRAPVERFVEKFAKIYTPLVFIVAIFTAVLPPLFFSGVWSEWIYRALALLVISCPCALVVSTPVAILSGLASATKKGLLIKGGIFLEEGRRLMVVAMDKTGTITTGRPARTDFIVLGSYDAKTAELLSASLANLSKHPVSQAVATGSLKKNELFDLEDFKDLPGLGVTANYQGRRLALGSPALMRERKLDAASMTEQLKALEAQGKTVVAFADGTTIAALIAVSDTIKPDSQKAVSELKALGIKTVMLTGDNAPSAAAVANQVGIDEFKSSLMPDEKLIIIEELAKQGNVGMVGDGINDAPALARANIGFSMGAAGTGTAIETADVAIMDDNLLKLPLFIRLSRAVHSILIQNIIFILIVKLSFIVSTLFGQTAMWMAVFADIGVCLIVMFNSMRLAKK